MLETKLTPRILLVVLDSSSITIKYSMSLIEQMTQSLGHLDLALGYEPVAVIVADESSLFEKKLDKYHIDSVYYKTDIPKEHILNRCLELSDDVRTDVNIISYRNYKFDSFKPSKIEYLNSSTYKVVKL